MVTYLNQFNQPNKNIEKDENKNWIQVEFTMV